MQALKLSSRFGWQWIGGGWRLFRKQPFGFASLLFFYWLLLLSASAVIGWFAQGLGLLLPFVSVELVAAIGSLFVAMLTPVLTVGFLQACRVAQSGLPVQPLLLFAPFRAGRRTLGRLLVLGSIQMIALVLILSMTSGADAFRAGEPPPASRSPSAASTPPTTEAGSDAPAKGSTPADSTPAEAAPTEADQEALRREAIARLVQGAAYLPVALLMWYAPMLVAWHGLPAGKALFFSVVAVWRNLGAFSVYGFAWLAIWISFSFAIGLVASLFGVGNFAAILAAPVVMLLLTCMYCSVYPTYASVFVDPAQPEVTPAVTPDP